MILGITCIRVRFLWKTVNVKEIKKIQLCWFRSILLLHVFLGEWSNFKGYSRGQVLMFLVEHMLQWAMIFGSNLWQSLGGGSSQVEKQCCRCLCLSLSLPCLYKDNKILKISWKRVINDWGSAEIAHWICHTSPVVCYKKISKDNVFKKPKNNTS